jgi:hypothetical protein
MTSNKQGWLLWMEEVGLSHFQFSSAVTGPIKALVEATLLQLQPSVLPPQLPRQQF